MKQAIEELSAWLTVRFGEGPGVAAGVLGASLAIGLLLHFVVLRGLAMLLSKTSTDLDERVLAALRGPVIFSVVLMGAYLAVQQLGASPEIAGQLLLTIGLSLWVVLGLRMARLLVKHASQMADRFDAIDLRTAPLFGNVATVLVIGLGLYLLMLIWGVDPTGWLASAGIVGVAVGFAAKDTLSNLFAGVFIIADAPYQIGDYIVLDDGVRGKVTHIGLRSTRVQTRDDVHITIPNSVIGMSKIVNQSGGGTTAMRVRIPVGVGYDSDVDQVRRILTEIADSTEGICEDPAPRVRFRALGASSLDFELCLWVPEPGLRGRTVDSVLTDVVRRFRKEQIEIPFPQRVIHMQPEG